MDLTLQPNSNVLEADRALRKHLEAKVEQEHPDWDPMEREELVDFLVRANDSVKTLVAAGVPLGIAKKMVEAVMNNETAEKSPEEVASLLGAIREDCLEADKEPESPCPATRQEDQEQ